MANIDKVPTLQQDSTGREVNKSSQDLGATEVAYGTVKDSGDGVTGFEAARDAEEGREAATWSEKRPPTSSETTNPLDSADKPDAQAFASSLASSPSPSAVAPTPTRPTLLQLNSNPSHSSSPTSTASAAPHPKKFSSVNINKKFFEKTSSGSAAASAMTGASSNSKTTANNHSRPPTQSTSPHPRLVTAKLTATTPSPSTVAGWSRPSSTAPPTSAAGANSPSGPTPVPSAPAIATTASTTSAPTAPQLPHAGKVIQPIPRSALAQQQVALPTGVGRDGSSGGSANKPAWSNIKAPPASIARPNVMTNDFPTAAEVAQGAASSRKGKPSEPSAKEVVAASSSAKLLRSEEADTFRGVHLDPNASHWDEMVEDDDNYWDNVIEFGDGRQYKVEVSEHVTTTSRAPSPPSTAKPSQPVKIESTTEKIVSKEDRFADDFDRSWPSGTRHVLPTGIQQHAMQESARVLFNERSNRLEPYSSHRSGHGTFPSKRGTFQERTVSPTEARSVSSTLHALPKTGGAATEFGSSRARRFSSASNTSFVSTSDRDRDRKDRKDGILSSPRTPRDNLGLPGRSASLRGKERDAERERADKDYNALDRGRRTAMGPPPIPSHAMRSTSRDQGGRQVPPHLAMSVSTIGGPPSTGRRFPSRDSRFTSHSGFTEVPPDVQCLPSMSRGRPHSPALSQASVSTKAALISPASPSLSLPALVGQDLEEIKKDVMQSAAARAKQRRQQEEEEREAQKERARKKAAELEAKMKAEAEEKMRKEKEADEVKREQEQGKAKETDSGVADKAVEVIQEAVDNIEKGTWDTDGVTQTHRTTSKAPHRRPPGLLLQGPGDASHPHRMSSVIASASTTTGTPSAAEIAESWRRSTPLPRQSDEPRPVQRRASSSATFMPPPPLDHIQSLTEGKKEDLEVVDFTDMDKLVDEMRQVKSSVITEQTSAPRRASRPVASDFFDDGPAPSVSPPAAAVPVSFSRNEVDGWRRKASSNPAEQHTKEGVEGSPVADPSASTEQISSSRTVEMSVESRHYSQIVSISPVHSGQQRTPRGQSFYHQAPMSSLVDAMSRIKGALHDMQAEELSKEGNPPDVDEAPSPVQNQNSSSLQSKPKDRWVPPSLRGRTAEYQEEFREDFYMTVVEPARSPKPSPSAFVIRLPSVSEERDPVHRRQLHLFSRSPLPARWDIMSFDPPVEGLNRRDLSLNDVLFRRPYGGFKGKIKYRVSLPKNKNSGPRVHIPGQSTSRTNNFGAFGKQTSADSLTSWRKPTSPLPPPTITDETMVHVDATSCSPPPELNSLSPSFTISPKTEVIMADGLAPARLRSQPKMPVGSGVAFYRDSRIDAVESEPKSVVNFIVSSEIDVPQSPQLPVPRDEKPEDSPTINVTQVGEDTDTVLDVSAAKPSTNGVKDETTAISSAIESEATVSVGKTEAKNSGKSSQQSPPWPTSKNLSVKESPARAPDPEHLKAVWSQTSDKAGLHSVNSLEGIADDLTALPFTLQDVKSEDGETPPPISATPSSRMSLHDVTRAFQQVPASSASTPHRPPISPPSTSAPVARPSSYSYPVPPNNMRPPYGPYPSPMMSHSPSPTMMYPHMISSPVPTRMQANGHAHMYNPPMWMPVQAPTQNSSSIMRPMASPYAPPLMAYPSNGAPMYAPAMNMPSTPQPQNNVQAHRNRNVPVMSPVMQHAAAHMYPASPGLLHMQVTPTAGYVQLPAGRGQTRQENGQMNVQHTSSANHPSPSHVGYSPVPPSPFMRPSW
ncbi:hypothetical protein AX17_000764 [Amanita inopinata Kibby_2008]|nr:hypothetical protein AX17_000764 [Amanita inopinata Kibby_2008]